MRSDLQAATTSLCRQVWRVNPSTCLDNLLLDLRYGPAIESVVSESRQMHIDSLTHVANCSIAFRSSPCQGQGLYIHRRMLARARRGRFVRLRLQLVKQAGGKRTLIVVRIKLTEAKAALADVMLDLLREVHGLMAAPKKGKMFGLCNHSRNS